MEPRSEKETLLNALPVSGPQVGAKVPSPLTLARVFTAEPTVQWSRFAFTG